jgi:hypothetical protein
MKLSMFSKNLLVTVSIVSIFSLSSVHALDSSMEEVSLGNRITAKLRHVWAQAPDLGVTENVKKQGTNFVKGKALDALEMASGKIAKAAANKFHALVYRDSSVHVVNDEGEHIGYVESIAPRMARNLMRQVGFDLETSIPGVPSVVMKVIGNCLENKIASYLQGGVFNLAKKATQKATLLAVGKAMGLAEEQLTHLLVAQGLSNTSIQQIENAIALDNSTDASCIKASLAKEVNSEEQDAYGNVVTALIQNAVARFKINLNSYIQEAAREMATSFAHKLIDETGEGALRIAEVGVTAGAAVVAGGFTGGTGTPALIAAAVAGDKYIAEGGKQKSLLRRGIEWLIGYDDLSQHAKETAKQAIPMLLNIDSILEGFGLGKYLVPTQEDFNTAYGKYEPVVVNMEGDDWIDFHQTEAPVNFTTLFKQASDRLAAAKEKVADVVIAAKTAVIEGASTVKNEIKAYAEAFGDAADAFAIALNPMLEEDEEEPIVEEHKLLQKARAKEAVAKTEAEKEGARKFREFVQAELSTPVEQPKRPFWKFW